MTISRQLLNRLAASTVRKKEIVLPPNRSQTSSGTLEFYQVDKLIKYHLSDPITWNSEVLSKIFGISEIDCESLTRYTQPMVYYLSRNKNEPEELTQVAPVVDIERLKKDKNYFSEYQALKVQRPSQRLPILALES